MLGVSCRSHTTVWCTPEADASHMAQFPACIVGPTAHAATSPAYLAPVPVSQQRWATLEEGEKVVYSPWSWFSLQLLGVPHICPPPLWPTLGNTK